MGREKLSSASIVTAAMAMIDAEGEKNFSMRKLAATLNVDLSGRYRGFADPSMIKTRFMAAFAKLIDAVAGDKSLLMIVEDLHWADPSTLEFLDQWVKQRGSLKLEGIQTIESWTANHPDTGHLIVGHILAWSPATRDMALGRVPEPKPPVGARPGEAFEPANVLRESPDFPDEF